MRKLRKLRNSLKKRKLISIPSEVTAERWSNVPWYHKMFCLIGWHKWEYDVDNYPDKYSMSNKIATFRQCKHCGHDQHLFGGEWRV